MASNTSTCTGLAFDGRNHTKIAVIGPTETGKTCLCERFDGQSLRSTQSPFPFIAFELDDICIKLDVFDVSGWDPICCDLYASHSSIEKIMIVTEMYLNRAQGFVLVFSVTDRKSFHEIDAWLQYVYKNSVSKFVILVGNKCDCLEDQRQVAYLEAKNFASVKGMLYVEVSAKDGTNVELILPTLATLIAGFTLPIKQPHQYIL